MIEKLGFQAYTTRELMKDEAGVADTFRRVAALGYDYVQTAGSGMTIGYETYARLAHEAGLTICGTHENFDELIADPEAAMEHHRILGTKNIGIGGYWAIETAEDIREFIRKANRFADTIAQHGFKFTYHNHHREFRRVEGKTVMEWLREGLDPDAVSFVLDTYWVQAGGADVRHTMEQLAGRIDILHLKDMRIKPDNMYEDTEIGHGNLWWEGILKTAADIGVQYYVVEQEDFLSADPVDCLAQSAEYLKPFCV